jgi:creatinine amidohydrolase
MRWEELTSDRFAAAVKECQGVALVILSVVERHGHHLPMGTDTYIGREIARRATEIEPAIIFPDYIFTQIPEARHLAGTIAIDGDLMVQLLDNVCRECARNGLKKVALLSAHGGNRGLVSLFNMLQLYTPKDYVVYLINAAGPGAGRTVTVPWPREVDGHAGPGETSMILATRPDLVQMDRVPTDDEGKARNRLAALREAGVEPGIWWYADHPTHYAGDASFSTAEAGDNLLTVAAEATARAIRAIKADTEAKRLQDAFFAGSAAPSTGESG